MTETIYTCTGCNSTFTTIRELRHCHQAHTLEAIENPDPTVKYTFSIKEAEDNAQEI
jgi:hypothetical protein